MLGKIISPVTNEAEIVTIGDIPIWSWFAAPAVPLLPEPIKILLSPLVNDCPCFWPIIILLSPVTDSPLFIPKKVL